MSKKKTFNEGDTVYYYKLHDGGQGHVESGVIGYLSKDGYYLIRTPRDTEMLYAPKFLYVTPAGAEKALARARRKKQINDLELCWDVLYDEVQELLKTVEALRKNTMTTIRDMEGFRK